MTIRRFISLPERRYCARIESNGLAITSTFPLTFLEIEPRDEDANQWEIPHWSSRLVLGFYEGMLSYSDIDRCEQVSSATVVIYPNPNSESTVRFEQARCFSYMITPDLTEIAAELELHWYYRASSVTDWSLLLKEKPVEKPLAWKKLGF